MATQASLDQIQNLYIAFYGRPADAAGQEYWADELEAAGGDLSAIINAFASSEEYQRNYGDLEAAELVNALYQQILGRDAEEAGLDFYVGELADGNITEGEIALAILNGAQGDDAAVLENRKAVADSFTATVEAEGKAYEGQEAEDAARALLEGVGASTNPADVDIAGTVAGFPDADGGTGEPTDGEMFTLTDGRDAFTGTEGDDTFMGLVGQNQNGASANAFSTGDYINGGEGTDKVEASMVNDNQVDNGENLNPAPRTENVEEVYIEALQDVTLDAGRMNSVEQYWTDNSAGDLIIEDVRLGDKLSATKDITFGLRDVDTDAGLYASFDTNSLVNEGTSNVNSQLLVRIADVTTATPEAPLSNVEVTVGFTFNGEEVVLEDIRSTDGTYTGMRAAIDAALDAQGLTGLVVTLDNPYNQVTIANNTVDLPFTAQEILVTDPSGKAFTDVTFEYNSIESVNDEFLVAGTAAPIEPGSVSSLIETNVVLDNAGRGSTAGEVIIGGMSNSDQAIEKLNLIVDRNSKVSNVFSIEDTEAQGWNNGNRVAFEQIEVTSGAAQGDLSIGNVGNVYNFDATAFEGENLTVSGQAGLTAVDEDWAPNAENVAHVYNTGDSNDTITVNYSGDKAAEFAGFSLSINSGAGNDNVHTVSNFVANNNLANQQDLDNVIINTGTGNDTVWTEGAGSTLVSTGAGNDVIYTDNSGTQWMSADAAAATWVINAQAANNDINDIDGNPVGMTAGVGAGLLTSPGQNNAIPAVLFGAELTVTFSGAGVGGGVTAPGSTAFDNGFESTVTILEGNEIFGDQRNINDAILRAINEDAVLNKLLVAEMGPDNTVVVRSLIDGEFIADDLEITVAAADATEFNATESSNIEDAIREATNDSQYDITDTGITLQDVLNASATTSNGLNGMGVDGGILAVAANSVFTAAVAAYPAGTSGDTITITIDGDSVTLTEGVAADFVGDGTNAPLVGLTVNVGGVTYTLGDSAGNLTISAPAGVDPTTVLVTDATGTVTVGAESTATADLTGTASTADNSGNVIDAGANDDLIVLSTEANSDETIVFEGNFGNDTIVNFTATGAGQDALDFSAYLTAVEQLAGSTSTESRDLFATNGFNTGVAGRDVAGNEVITINDFDSTAVANQTWESMTAANLLAAIQENTTGYGDIADATLDVDSTIDSVNDNVKAIVMIENDANAGEYKVFELTGTVDAATAANNDFTNATLVGVVDFGETVDASTLLFA